VTIAFEGQDIAFDIDEVIVAAGQEITVELNNVGELDHNWILTTDDIRPRNATEADALTGTNSGIVTAGQSKSFTFTAPEAGSYKFVCTIEGHAFAGMVGDFTVE
ncbi:MAG: plastocyanin/azurin family copper-binding protein, partial [Chloroflexota bacterium]